MIHIHLSEKNVFVWNKHKNTYVCGYGYVDDEYMKGSKFAEKIHLLLKNNSTDELFKKIDGCFAFIHRAVDSCIVAVDHIRSIPILYAQKGDDFYVSDDAEWIRSSLQLHTLNKKNTAEFLIAHFVTGSDTLFPEIKQLRAGEALEYTNRLKSADSLTSNRYFTFSRKSAPGASEDELIEQLDQVHLTVFKNLIESLNDRQAVVPLSGGFDSRLIAVIMHRLGYDNLKFISYGRPGNWESRISREVADYLETDWHFVPLDQQIWADAFQQDDRKNFTFSAGNFSSHTIIQEFPVIQSLKQQGIINEDAVFIPGHSGGFTSGAHIPASFLSQEDISRIDLYNYILKKNYQKWNWKSSDENYTEYFHEKIHHLLNAPDRLDSGLATALYEEWIWQERQAKFIINSIRNFEHFGYEWRLPLWNKKLVNFWQSVPLDVAARQTFFKKYVDKKTSLPVTKANSPRLSKAIDRYFPTAKAWIGRYIGTRNILQAINVRIQEILPASRLPYDFIPAQKRVLFTDINAMGSLQYLVEIMDRTGAETKVN